MAPDPEKARGQLEQPCAIQPVSSVIMFRALQIAAEEVGVTEQPPGSNGGPRVNEYLVGVDGRGDWLLDLNPENRPWCARFVAWCIARAVTDLGPLTIDPLRGAARGGGLASGDKWLRWAKSAAALRQAPSPGLVGILPRKRGHHVAMCWAVVGETVWCVEGNSDGRVQYVPRPIGSFVAWIEV